MQSLKHLLLRGRGITQQQVAANRSAHKRVALRNIRHVAAREGRDGFNATVVIHLNFALLGYKQTEDYSHQRTLSRTRAAEDSRQTTRAEVAREVVQHLVAVTLVAECYALKTNTHLAIERDGLALLLERHIGKLGQTIDRGGDVDEGRKLMAQLQYGALNLADQLQKGGHHTERDHALPQAKDSPQEGDHISAHKSRLNHTTREERVVGAAHNLLAQIDVHSVQILLDVGRVLHRRDQHAVAHILLHMCLHAAVHRAYIARIEADAAHISFAEEQEQRHNQHQHTRQSHVQQREERKCRNELYSRCQERR